jgi:RNA polymerase sigma-70 factor (family 1)
MENNHEAALIERFKFGNIKAFGEIFECHNRLLYYFVRRLIGDDIEAQDIVFDTFRKLWLRKDHFESLANIKAFLYITARNSGIDYLRLIKQRKEAEKALAIYTDISVEEIDNKIVETELLEEVYNKINDLPETERKIFKLHYEEGMSLKEIAGKLNISQESVRVKKYRALELIRRLLNPKRLLPVLVAIYLFFV